MKNLFILSMLVGLLLGIPFGLFAALMFANAMDMKPGKDTRPEYIIYDIRETRWWHSGNRVQDRILWLFIGLVPFFIVMHLFFDILGEDGLGKLFIAATMLVFTALGGAISFYITTRHGMCNWTNNPYSYHPHRQPHELPTGTPIRDERKKDYYKGEAIALAEIARLKKINSKNPYRRLEDEDDGYDQMTDDEVFAKMDRMLREITGDDVEEPQPAPETTSTPPQPPQRPRAARSKPRQGRRRL